MRRVTNFENYERVESFNLTEEQHNVAVDLARNNKRKVGSYTLEEVDSEMVNVWIADAFSEGETEYAEWLQRALAVGADIYTFKDDWQEIGEVIVI